MSRLIHFLARLYPRSWRERYGADYTALLEDVRPDARTAADVFTGALAMQVQGWKSWKILAASALFGATVCIGMYLASPKLYRGVISVNFPGYLNPPGDTAYKLSRTDLANIITKERLYERERARRPLDDAIDEMGKRVTIDTNGTSFSIAFADTDPHAARGVVIDIFSVFVGRWGARATVWISNVHPVPLRYRREAGRGLIVASVSSFLLMWGGLSVMRRIAARGHA